MTFSAARAAGLTIGAATLAAVAVMPGAAGAKGKCSLPATSPAPTLTSPCTGATVTKGHAPMFTAYDKGAKSGSVFIELTRNHLNPHAHGFPPAPSAGGFYGSMKAVAGHPGHFAYVPTNDTFPTSWLQAPGTYYIQLDHTAPGMTSYGPVSVIHVTG